MVQVQQLSHYLTQHFAIVLFMGALLAHYLSVHYYTYYCTSWGVWGFMRSAWRIESLQCRAANWLFTYSYNYLHNIWAFVGALCMTWVIRCFQFKE